jgi:predicted nuclease with RNAse H fold
MDGAPTVFVGVDVQTRRGCACVALDGDSAWLGGKWTSALPPATGERARRAREAIAEDIVDFCRYFSRTATVAVGIDAPRAPLSAARRWYWDGARLAWRPRARAEKGLGRHADVVVAAAEGVRIQWTPLARGRRPGWMELGFAIFTALEARLGRSVVHEVFPSASYAQFARESASIARLDLREFRRGPKDMLDAAVAALTVREFVAGRGCEVGGCDGLGTIVLARPVRSGAPEALLKGWRGL